MTRASPLVIQHSTPRSLLPISKKAHYSSRSSPPTILTHYQNSINHTTCPTTTLILPPAPACSMRTNPLRLPRLLLSPHRPYSTASQSTPKPNAYVVALRKFFLKVHPDFFEAHPNLQKENQESFVKLNLILDWLSQLRSNRQPPRPLQTPIQLVFHLRKSHKQVHTTFTIPSNAASTVSRDRAELLVDKCVYQLLTQAEVELPEGLKDRDFDSSTTTTADAPSKPSTQTKAKKDTLREELRFAVENDLYKRDPSLVKYGWWTEALPEVDAMVESNMLLFHKDISPIQSMEALEKMKMSIQELKFHLWSDIPIMFGKEYDIEQMKGIIMVPYDFVKEEFIDFVQKNAKKAREYAEQTMKEVDEFDERVEYIKDKLQLDMLTISVPAKLANECTLRLKQIVDDGALSEIPLKDAHIVIGEEFYIDMNNACIGIAHDFKDADELQRFFHFVNHDNIVDCAKKNIREKDVIQQLNQTAAEILGRIGCVELNIDDYCDVSPDLKLKCLQRLKDYCIMLKQYGWDEYRVFLSDEIHNVEVKRADKVVYLPVEFSEGDLFHKVSTADKQERAELEGRVLDKEGQIVPEEFSDVFRFQQEVEQQYKEELVRAQQELEEEERRLKEIEESERKMAQEKEEAIRREFEKEFAHMMEEYELDLEDVLSKEDLAFLHGEREERV